MAIVEIIYPAKCKDCAHVRAVKEGRRRVTRCARELRLCGKLYDTTTKGWPVTLRTPACDAFKLFGS